MTHALAVSLTLTIGAAVITIALYLDMGGRGTRGEPPPSPAPSGPPCAITVHGTTWPVACDAIQACSGPTCWPLATAHPPTPIDTTAPAPYPAP